MHRNEVSDKKGNELVSKQLDSAACYDEQRQSLLGGELRAEALTPCYLVAKMSKVQLLQFAAALLLG